MVIVPCPRRHLLQFSSICSPELLGLSAWDPHSAWDTPTAPTLAMLPQACLMPAHPLGFRSDISSSMNTL